MMRLGFFIILAGALFLLKGLGYITPNQWPVLWPTIVLLVGIALTVRCNCRCHGCDCENGICNHNSFNEMSGGMGKKDIWKNTPSNTCDCTCESCKSCHGIK